jgi:glutamyl-tRNA reductase
LIVVGLNHRTVPVGLMERMAVPEPALAKALHDLGSREHLLEVAILSTCNRTEIYAYCSRFHAAVGDVVQFLADYSGAAADELSEHVYTYYDDAAVTHLFGVAAGLDSMIVGENEILGQVRDAWQLATDAGTASTLLGYVFRHAVEAGKRVRTETELNRHPVSVSSAAVAVASEHMGGLEGARVLVIGAGEMGEGMALAIALRDIEQITIANRTVQRADELAARVSGRVVALTDVARELADADLVLASTGSSEVLIERSVVEAAMQARRERPLLIVDVALPRDFDPGVGEVPGVLLLDLDDLKDFAQRSSERRRVEIGKARAIITDAVERYLDERRQRIVAPVISALRRQSREIRATELERFTGKLARLDTETLAAVEALVDGVVNKLLHEPTVRLKESAGTDRGDLYVDAVRALFALDDDAGAPKAGAAGTAAPGTTADPAS